MRLNPAAFNRHLDHIGQSFRWRKAFACPCVDQNSGAADYNCPRCHGQGVIWNAAVDAKAGVASQSVQTRWAQSGRWEDGDLVLSVQGSSPMWAMGIFDRVTSMNASDPFSMALVRGAPTERLRFIMDSVQRVFWYHPTTGAIVEGKAPVQADDGSLAWPDGGAPPDGMQYSLSGTKRLEYYVYDQLPRNRNEHHGARLPKAVVLRRFDLFGRGFNQGSA